MERVVGGIVVVLLKTEARGEDTIRCRVKTETSGVESPEKESFFSIFPETFRC